MKSMTLLVITCVLSFTAHAADSGADDCDAKIKALENISKTDGQALHGGMAHDYHEKLKQAKDAQGKGDMKGCRSAAEQAQTIYNKARGK
ncbi:hypothetical protein [Pseudomonas oryziphila]|uniref:PsiF repeat-containing protein n=1 Tax=Pseudomonas oryziphila TaxID=2894079 RepID=A0ABN5TN56_9PSED|nr:hypothetical protein [Pseudomonas oryziphila]AZL76504.1 hypothetical protein EI693_15170 [Pseudomonas oryziphila]